MNQSPAATVTLLNILIPGISAILGAYIGGKMSVKGARDAAEISMREQRDIFDESRSLNDDANFEIVRKTASLILSEMLSWIELSARMHNMHRDKPLPVIDFNEKYRDYLAELIPHMTVDQIKLCIHFYGNTKRLSLLITDPQVADAQGVSNKIIYLSGQLLNDFFPYGEPEVIRTMPYDDITQDALMVKVKQPARDLMGNLRALSGMNVFMG